MAKASPNPGAVDCERCWNYIYDEYTDSYFCRMELDEDELGQFLSGTLRQCPYFRFNDEYEVVRKQN